LHATTSKKIKYIEFILFVIVVIWGLNTPVMKMGLNVVPPLVYNTLRMGLASVITLTALYATGTYKPMPAKDIKHIAALGVFGIFMNQIFIIFGMTQTTAGNAALIMATLPLLVALINRLLGLEHISPRMTGGIVVSLAGVIFVVLGSDKEISLTGPHLIGAVLVLVGQFCYAYYTVLFRRLTIDYSPYQIIATVMTISALLFGLVTLPDLISLQWSAIPAAGWYSIVFSAVLALSLANFVWIRAVGIMGSTKASLYPNLCPVFSIAFAWYFMDETLGFLQAIGAGVTFLGLFLTRSQSY
jgi:O-acetylserine/cysteine efflux transporter